MNVVVVSSDIYVLPRPRQLARVLALGGWGDFVFEVTSCGAFPCVCVGVPRNHPAASKLAEISSIVSGRMTIQTASGRSNGRWWFGWEYDDYGRKWSIWEILGEVHKVAKRLN